MDKKTTKNDNVVFSRVFLPFPEFLEFECMADNDIELESIVNKISGLFGSLNLPEEKKYVTKLFWKYYAIDPNNPSRRAICDTSDKQRKAQLAKMAKKYGISEQSAMNKIIRLSKIIKPMLCQSFIPYHMLFRNIQEIEHQMQ